MTSTDPSVKARFTALESAPRFELFCYVDDVDSPTTVTICAEEVPEDIPTEWITIDSSFAIPIDECR